MSVVGGKGVGGVVSGCVDGVCVYAYMQHYRGDTQDNEDGTQVQCKNKKQ